MNPMRSVLMVCMGNICRSPLAEGLLRARAAERGLALRVDSAGTHDYHRGEPPDARARAVARWHGIDIDAQRARAVGAEDFARFDRVLVADRHNLAQLNTRFGAAAGLAELLLPACSILSPDEVPDPYYGGNEDFEQVFALLDRAVVNLLRDWPKPA